MAQDKLFFWARASSPFNSIIIQIDYIVEILMNKYGLIAEILNPEIDGFSKRLKSICDEKKILFWHYGGFDANILRIRNKKNIIFVYHNITPAKFYWRSEPLVGILSLLGRLQLVFLRKDSKWITMSEFNRSELESFGFKNILICPNVIKTTKIDEVTKTIHFSLIFVGRISPHKNCIQLLLEVEKVASFLKEEVELIIVGSAKPKCAYGKKFQIMVESLSNHNWLKISWKQNLSNIELTLLYKRSWLYLSMSKHEGFGVPACDSIANGTPAIYLSCGGQESVLENFGLVKKEMINGFSKVIVTYLLHKAMRESLLNQQFKIVESFISPNIDNRIYTVYGN